MPNTFDGYKEAEKLEKMINDKDFKLDELVAYLRGQAEVNNNYKGSLFNLAIAKIHQGNNWERTLYYLQLLEEDELLYSMSFFRQFEELDDSPAISAGIKEVWNYYRSKFSGKEDDVYELYYYNAHGDPEKEQSSHSFRSLYLRCAYDDEINLHWSALPKVTPGIVNARYGSKKRSLLHYALYGYKLEIETKLVISLTPDDADLISGIIQLLAAKLSWDEDEEDDDYSRYQYIPDFQKVVAIISALYASAKKQDGKEDLNFAEYTTKIALYYCNLHEYDSSEVLKSFAELSEIHDYQFLDFSLVKDWRVFLEDPGLIPVLVENFQVLRQLNINGSGSLLHRAIHSRCIGSLKLLLKSGVDPRIQNAKGYNAVFFAAQNNIYDPDFYQAVADNQEWKSALASSDGISLWERTNPSNKKLRKYLKTLVDENLPLEMVNAGEKPEPVSREELALLGERLSKLEAGHAKILENQAETLKLLKQLQAMPSEESHQRVDDRPKLGVFK